MNKAQRVAFIIIMVYSVSASAALIYLVGTGLVWEIPWIDKFVLFSAIGGGFSIILFARRLHLARDSILYDKLGYLYGLFFSIIATIVCIVWLLVDTMNDTRSIVIIGIVALILVASFVIGTVIYLVMFFRLRKTARGVSKNPQ